MKIGVLWLVLLLSSCASIVAGGPDRVPVTSAPPGADVLLDGTWAGRTPLLLAIPRDLADSHTVRLELAGHAPQDVRVGKVVNGWLFGNLLSWNIIGIWVDFAAGNASKVSSSAKVDVRLTESRPAN